MELKVVCLQQCFSKQNQSWWHAELHFYWLYLKCKKCCLLRLDSEAGRHPVMSEMKFSYPSLLFYWLKMLTANVSTANLSYPAVYCQCNGNMGIYITILPSKWDRIGSKASSSQHFLHFRQNNSTDELINKHFNAVGQCVKAQTPLKCACQGSFRTWIERHWSMVSHKALFKAPLFLRTASQTGIKPSDWMFLSMENIHLKWCIV